MATLDSQNIRFTNRLLHNLNSWPITQSFEEDANEDGTKDYVVTIAFDNNPLLATNNIIAYEKIDSRLPELVIWITNQRSQVEFIEHGGIKSYTVISTTLKMYVLRTSMVNDRYVLKESRVLERKTTQKGKIPMFENSSPFGISFVAFFKSLGKTEDEIEAPTLEFLE
ncbi:MAG: hypothetical protein HYS57_00590 [Parcubacteria group bacterium]|nr:hypothetical protein [Parcubacteria group bacterium]